MDKIKILIIISAIFLISCSSVKSIDNTSQADKTAVVNTTAATNEETIKIYGQIKVESENVYIITNWKSKSMVTYKIIGRKKFELAKNNGKYVFVNAVLIHRETWSGTIDVTSINSIDEIPDTEKEKNFKLMKSRKFK